MVSRLRGLLAGVAAAALLASVGAVEIVTASGGARTISLYNIHTKETVSVLYKKDGRYVEASLEKINHVLRDHRRNEATKMDPELVDLLWEMHHELGSKEPIHVISGFRSRTTNELLRRTVGGQASESRHILGKAADVHFPDVPLKSLRYSAMVRERGGVGYYPTSALPFVHVDTDRVRSWPRLPRFELALLFPSGATRHAAADGGSITREDVQIAKSRYGDLATQLAAFHGQRRGERPTAVADASRPVTPVQVAALAPTAAEPRLIDPPKPIQVARPSPAGTGPSAGDRARLAELVAFASAGSAPQLLQGPMPVSRPKPALPSLTGTAMPAPGIFNQPAAPAAPKMAALGPPTAAPGTATLTDSGSLGPQWTSAPAYDDEHPDELSYRPFPIAPFLTDTANTPLMSDLVHHDVARTVELLDQPGSVPPLRFRAGEQTARLLWAQQFTGEASGLSKLQEAKHPAGVTSGGVQSRSVRTSQN